MMSTSHVVLSRRTGSLARQLSRTDVASRTFEPSPYTGSGSPVAFVMTLLDTIRTSTVHPVFDATPLIYLAKVDRLGLVEHLEASCVIPDRVYEEVVRGGIEEGYPDARRIERQVEAGRFEVVSVEATPHHSRLQGNSSPSDADVAVLACAYAHDGIAVMDETYGRDVAAAEGITTRGTAFLALKCTKRGAISGDDARTIIDAMIDEGWYCAPDVYTRIVERLETLSE